MQLALLLLQHGACLSKAQKALTNDGTAPFLHMPCVPSKANFHLLLLHAAQKQIEQPYISHNHMASKHVQAPALEMVGRISNSSQRFQQFHKTDCLRVTESTHCGPGSAAADSLGSQLTSTQAPDVRRSAAVPQAKVHLTC